MCQPIIKPTRVLCKRNLTSGDPFYYVGFSKVKRDNRMLVAGQWYEVVSNPNDGPNTFTIIDNQGHPHLHYIYTEEEKKSWPDICTDYGPRDYAKWFYTPAEIRTKRLRSLL